jgi:nitrate/nitrite transporter NarK
MTNGPSTKYTPDKFRTLILWVLMVSTQFQVFNFTVFVLPIMREFSITYAQAGLLQTALFVPYAIMQALAGGVADKYPPKRLLIFSSTGTTVCSIIFGLVSSFYELLLLRAVMGVSLAFIFVTSVRSMLESGENSRVGRELGAYASSLAFGPLIAAVAPAMFSEFTNNWRTAVVALNSIGIIPLLLLILIPWDSRSVPGKSSSSVTSGSIKSVLKRKETWVLGYDQLLRFGVGTSISTWIPTFVIQAHNFSTFESGLIVGGAWAIAMVSIPAGGVLSDKVKKRFFVIELAVIALVPSILIFGTVSSYYLVWITMLVVGGIMYLHFGPLFTVIPEIYGQRRIGLVTGIEGSLGACGAFMLPTIIGYLKDTSGTFNSSWCLISLMAAAAAVVSLYLRRY